MFISNWLEISSLNSSLTQVILEEYLLKPPHQMWYGTSVIPALERLRQEDEKIKARLNYIARLYLDPPCTLIPPPKKKSIF
jgi:hypothetical protein